MVMPKKSPKLQDVIRFVIRLFRPFVACRGSNSESPGCSFCHRRSYKAKSQTLSLVIFQMAASLGFAHPETKTSPVPGRLLSSLCGARAPTRPHAYSEGQFRHVSVNSEHKYRIHARSDPFELRVGIAPG
eukprot:s2332_g9.t1